VHAIDVSNLFANYNFSISELFYSILDIQRMLRINSSFHKPLSFVIPKQFNALPRSENTACGLHISRFGDRNLKPNHPLVKNNMYCFLGILIGFWIIIWTLQSLNFLLWKISFFCPSLAIFYSEISFVTRAPWIGDSRFKRASANAGFYGDNFPVRFSHPRNHLRMSKSVAHLAHRLPKPILVLVWDSKDGLLHSYCDRTPTCLCRISDERNLLL